MQEYREQLLRGQALQDPAHILERGPFILVNLVDYNLFYLSYVADPHLTAHE